MLMYAFSHEGRQYFPDGRAHAPIMCDGHPDAPAVGIAQAKDTGADVGFCADCAAKVETDALLKADRIMAYLHVPESGQKNGQHWHITTGSTLQTFTGITLARVTYLSRERHNIGGYLYHFRTVDVHGQHWYGTSPGPSMYARMRKCKARKAR